MPHNGNNLDLTRTAIIGAGGYTGAEVAGLLSNHPQAQLVGLFASANRAQSEQPQSFGDLFPRFRGLIDLEVQAVDLDAIGDLKPHVVFLATPHEVSHDLAPALLEMGSIVIDLSAAFRLKEAALYPRHYGFEHQHPELLSQAVYGLPEINGDLIPSTELIAAPGCYPTSAILPLHPLVESEALAPNWQPIIDSTSGVSGAGRSAVLKSHFCEVSLQPYNVFSHRHAPEIAAHAGAPVIFTPHLGAFERGILSTIHVRLAKGSSAQRVTDLFQEAYGDKPFVRLLPAGQWPSVAAVRHTNFCDIGWAVDEGGSHLIVFSAIDNLLKGAAGQAVQCMNIRLGLPETTGLLKEAACTAPLS
ncbi:MAG: N-acetyl-gamma-glutamyl-phosphate reductase [Phycisphaerales bacterium]|nr:N-acetyl-gamma-glutamyl-phosphate reductase [Phycisphaerales bacterium]